MKVLLILITVLSFTLNSHSQQKDKEIQGTIIYENDSIIEFAKLFLLNTDSVVVQTNFAFDGKYNFEQVETGIFILLVHVPACEKIYKTISIDDSTYEIDTIRVKYSRQLEMIDVVGETPNFKYEIGKYSLKIADEGYFEGQNLLEVLSTLPGVIVEDGIISINGENNVKVKIDGIEYSGSMLVNILNSLTSEDIEKIAVITESFSKTDADASGGVIEIHTSKHSKKGYYIDVFGSLGMGQKFRNSQGASFGISANKYVAKIALYRNDNSFIYESFYYRSYKLNGFNLSQEIVKNKHTNNLPIHATINYFPKPKHSIYLSYFGFFQNTNEETFNNNLCKNSGGENILILNTNNSSKKNETNNDIGIIYNFGSDTAKFTFQIKSNFYHNNWLRNGLFIEESDIIIEDHWKNNYSSESLTKSYITNTSIDFSNQLFEKKIKLSYGVKHKFLNIQSQQEFIKNKTSFDSLKSNNNSYSETVDAVYSEMEFSFNEKIKILAGVRGEYTIQNGLSILNNFIIIDTSYFNLFPSIGLSYKPTKKIFLSAYYSKKIDRPNINELNPYLIYYDSLSYKRGNPALKPSLVNSLGIDIVYKKIIRTSIFFNKYKEFQSMFVQPLSDTLNTYILSQINYPRFYIGGIAISVPLPKIKNNRFVISANWNYNRIYFEDNKTFLEGNNFFFKINHSYSTKSKRTTLSSSFLMRSSGISGIFSSKQLTKFDIGISQKFLKKGNLKIILRYSDIFNRYIQNVSTDLVLLTVSGKEYKDIRNIKLTIRYSFGKENDIKRAISNEDRNRIK